MKIYTIKNEHGTLFPKVVCELPRKAESVVDGKIVEVDYGLEAIEKYLGSVMGEGFELAICELSEIV